MNLQLTNHTLVNLQVPAFQRVPPEILGLILSFNADELRFPPRRYNAYAPHEVSRFWRNAALPTPALWLNIELDRFCHIDGDPLWPLQYLQRSGSLLLNVSIYLPNEQRANIVDTFVGIILAHASRWGTLHETPIPNRYVSGVFLATHPPAKIPNRNWSATRSCSAD